LRNGFPARIHYRLELWSKGGFGGDDRTGLTEWDVLVSYDPTSQLFNVIRRTVTNETNVMSENFGGFASLSAAEAQFGRPYHPSIHPERSGAYYYKLSVAVQKPPGTDTDAPEQWRRRPFGPQR